MAESLSSSIREYARESGFDDELVANVVKQSLQTAYKRQYGTDENLDFETDEDGEIYMVSNKVVVEKVKNPVFEISLEVAQSLVPECEVGDQLAVEENVHEYRFHAVQAGKQRAIQSLREAQKDILYSEYISKVGEIIIGYYRREHRGNIYVDLGKVEGILPKRLQSPRDHFSHEDNRIKALVKEVKKQRMSNTVQLVLSRSDTDFVRRIFELEVPEIYSGTVEIKNIVREAGNRTKVAVQSNKFDVDPVGACVGQKGSRIQVVITELDGEKVDIILYSDNPIEYIKSALSPAQVDDVIILDEEKRSALAIVDESQLAIAIGRNGLNVRLANRLVDWNVEVKTEEQFKEMGDYKDIKKAVEELFTEEDEETTEDEAVYEETLILSEDLIKLLADNGITDIENVLDMSEQELSKLEGMKPEMLNELLTSVNALMNNEKTEAEVEYYECPECAYPITVEMSNCPNCGVGLIFEEYDPEDDVDYNEDENNNSVDDVENEQNLDEQDNED